MLNVDRISIYTKTNVTTDSDQTRQMFLGQEELKVRRIGHDAMMEQDAVYIGYEADATAYQLDTDEKKDRSNRTSRYMSSSRCNVDKDMGKDGLQQGGPNTDEFKIGSRQLRSDLHSWEKSNNTSPLGRKELLDEFPCGGEPG